MKDYDKLTSLQDFVLSKKDKNEDELKKAAKQWVVASAKNKIVYEIEWLGIPVIQTPEDLILMQELIFKIKPDVLIETGIAHGGSLIFYASLFELIGKGKVIGIDIEIKEHNRKVLEVHPMFDRIQMIEGDSLAEENLEAIQKLIPPNATVLVALDSCHTREHVYNELKKYSRFVTKNSYMVVFDTHTSDMVDGKAAPDYYKNNGPLEAINLFLSENDNYGIDKMYNKLYISYSPDGYLKKIK